MLLTAALRAVTPLPTQLKKTLLNFFLLSFFTGIANGTMDIAWIGFSDFNSKGNYTWKDGTPATYTNWIIGHPNEIEQHCILVSKIF